MLSWLAGWLAGLLRGLLTLLGVVRPPALPEPGVRVLVQAGGPPLPLTLTPGWTVADLKVGYILDVC